MHTDRQSASRFDRLSALEVLGRFPKRGLVNIPEHRMAVARITRLDRLLVLFDDQVNRAYPGSRKKGETYAQPKTHLAHQRLHLYQIQLCQRAMGLQNVKKGSKGTALERNKNIVVRVRGEGVHTEIDPTATWCKDAMGDTRVFYDIISLAAGADWGRV